MRKSLFYRGKPRSTGQRPKGRIRTAESLLDEALGYTTPSESKETLADIDPHTKPQSDTLTTPAGRAPDVLDPDQAALVDQWDAPLLVVSAGPGAGKTSTLCALVARIRRERPDARILMLAYNRVAEQVLEHRLSLLGVGAASRHLTVSDAPGCFVLTFDKYGYRRTQASRSESDADSLFAAMELTGSPRTEPGSEPGPEPGPGSGPEPGEGYRIALEKAALLPAAEKWDWVFVDEAQDVQSVHARLIDSLRLATEHLVVAGDPRQELYPGAVWFSRLWATLPVEDRRVLRYNHRSTPAIVDALNKYSRVHFPQLHFDQIAVRREGGGVNLLSPSQPKRGRYAADRMTAIGQQAAATMSVYAPGSSYAIAPVTVSKFRVDVLGLALRQRMYEQKPGARVCTLDRGAHIDREAYCFGTPFAVKGTERSHVVIVAADEAYTECGVSRVGLLKSKFVAMSRAQDRLDIITGKSGPIAAALNSTTERKKRKELNRLTHVDVTQMSLLECWTPAQSKVVANFDPVDVKRGDDPDFIGVFVEEHVAGAAGLSNSRLPLIARHRTVGEKTGLYSEWSSSGRVRALVYDPRKWEKAPEEIADLIRRLEGHPEYAEAAAIYSAKISRLWTVSERLCGSPPEHIAPYAKFVSDYVQGGTHHARVRIALTLHRSSKTAGYLVGETDFSTEFDSKTGTGDGAGARVVEMKHAKGDASHANQARIYAAMLGAPEAVVLNSLEGTAVMYPAACVSEVVDLARASLALKRGIAAGMRLEGRLAYAPTVSTHCAVGAVWEGPHLLEVAAVVFEAGTDQIRGRYHHVNRGAGPGPTPSGLQAADVTLMEGPAAMMGACASWAESVAPAHVEVRWDGSAGLRPRERPAGLRLREQFSAWSHDDCKDVFDAAAVALDTLRHTEEREPFRAYEEAVMVAALFNAIMNCDGAL